MTKTNSHGEALRSASGGRLLVAFAIGCGCGGKSATDSFSPPESSSTSAGETSSTTWSLETSESGSGPGPSSATTVTTTEESTTGEPACPIDDHFLCDEVPWDCSAVDEWSSFHCGAPTSWFDERGCLREACDVGAPCPAGFECFAPNEVCGVCFGPRPVCEESTGASGVGCGCSNDGACGGSVCVPAELLAGDPCPGGGTSSGSSST